VGTPQVARSFVHTPPSRDPQYRQQDAAADIIRSQISAIYGNDPQKDTPKPEATSAPSTQQEPHVAPQNTPAPQQADPLDINPYERTHTEQTAVQADQWKAYHSAWQDYYKRYYEGYYTKEVHATKQRLEMQAAEQPAPAQTKQAIGSLPMEDDSDKEPEGPLTKKQAMQQLRKKLLAQVEQSAHKVRKSRHFIPIVAALGVVLVFVFIQFNQVLIANVKAYVTPGAIDPQNIIVDPASTVEVGPEPRLIIPKINVDTPVFYDIATDTASQNKAMENGVAHFPISGANSHPGQIGNTVLSGHSSNDVFAAGDYKFIFMQLDKLEVGDTIYANYQGTRYTYVVTKKAVVSPTNVSALIYDTDKPEMTLITCTPLGTALNRLLVTAEQVFPTDFKPAPENTGSSDLGQTSIPGQGAPTLLETIFGS
jgi:sortase A